jgi:arabinogalactan endo-1,4-beta-galactosidase
MKKVSLYTLIVLVIAIFLLTGCKTKSVEEVIEEETVVETKETTSVISETIPQTIEAETLLQKPIYTSRIGVGATAYDWFAQKIWGATWDMIDPVSFLAEHGFNWLRVGVTTVTAPELESDSSYLQNWKDGYWCSREYALQVMEAGANADMHLCLFFYLSDRGACAANQNSPVQWQDYSLEETASALKEHTYETTKYYKDKGLKIELYEIGNEIEFGICGYSNDTQLSLPGVNYLTDISAVRKGIWEKEAFLLKAAIEGVLKADPEARIVLHISTSQYPNVTEAFFQAMDDFDVPYDLAGLSYYPWTNYHPDIPIPTDCLELSINAIADLDKKVVISEVSFPSDKEPLMPVQEIPGYPFNLEGQAKWVRDFLNIAESNPQIEAVFYFYPDNYLIESFGSAALFSDDKHPKPALYEFNKFQSATIDTISPVVKSILIEPTVVKNSDVLKVTVDCGEIGLHVTVDISELDSTKTSSVMLTHDVDGTYKGEIQISSANEIGNGIKPITVEAIDSSGNIGNATANVELKNFTSVIDEELPHDSFDGVALDISKWKLESYGGGIVKQNEKLILSTDDKQEFSSARIQSVWKLTGNFDIQVDFHIGEGWSCPTKEHLDGAILGVLINGQSYHITRLIRDDAANMLFAWDSGSTIGGQLYTDVLSGKYRLVRVGTTLTLLYDIGNGWQELASGTVPLSPANVYMGNGSINASHAFTTYFDNFLINSGITTY